MPSGEEREILTTEEVAKMLRISVGGLRNTLSKNPSYLPGVKVGRVWRFERSKVLEHFGFSTNKLIND